MGCTCKGKGTCGYCLMLAHDASMAADFQHPPCKGEPSRDSRAEVIEKLERLIATFERRAQDSTLSSSTDCWNTAADDARTLLPLLRKDGR